jgi:hypothetical protein
LRSSASGINDRDGGVGLRCQLVSFLDDPHLGVRRFGSL